MRKSERSVRGKTDARRARERFETMNHDESVRSPFLHHTDVTSHETIILKPDDDDARARRVRLDAARGLFEVRDKEKCDIFLDIFITSRYY